MKFYYQAVYFYLSHLKKKKDKQKNTQKKRFGFVICFVLYKYFHCMAKWKSRTDKGSAFLQDSQPINETKPQQKDPFQKLIFQPHPPLLLL